MLHPLRIGHVTLKHNILFGPMAGISDLPYRLLCHEQNAALTVTELISAKAVTYRNKNTVSMLEIHPDEHPVAVQLFGHEPEIMAQAARMIMEGYGARDGNKALVPDFIDINAGCPVPKVVGNGDGCALMKEPKLIEEIVRACRTEVSPTITVKMRAGMDPRHVNAVECALAAEAGGAAAVTIHARTRDRMYAGRADWSVIRAVKEALSIPVIGNGDVTDAGSARRMMEETGCDGVMVARAAQGNPWIFREIVRELETGEPCPRPTPAEILAMLLRHMELLEAYKGSYTAVREMRKHIAWYTAGFPGAAKMRERVNRIEDAEEMKEACNVFFVGE